MKLWHWKLLILLLCVWDTAATHCIVTTNITSEGNPLMDAVISEHGWGMVWLIKVGLGGIFVYAMPKLLKSLWGKILVSTSYVVYLSVAVVHIFLLNLS